MKYFLWIDEKKQGPYDVEQICEMLQSHNVALVTLGLAEDGSGEWSQIASFPGVIYGAQPAPEEPEAADPAAAEPVPRAMNKYERPTLASILYWLGVLALVGAVLCLFESLYGYGIAVALAGIVYFGIGQAVDYLARTAHSTDRLCTILETSIADRLKSIEGSLPPTNSASSQPAKGYYFSTDGQQQGPLSAADLRDMRRDGLITDWTPVLREGDPQWRTYRDYLALTR